MSKTVMDSYAARVASGDFRADPAQEAVLPAFERIRTELIATAAPARKLAFWRRPPAAPRGFYLWGGVGRGKSMLMDIFFDLAPRPKRRVHFHEFMQEIQQSLHEARQSGQDDPMRPLAAKIADEARLLCFDEMQITDITDAMIVGRLFELLFDAGVVVVATSNRAPEGLYENGLNRQLFLPFIDLIKTRMEVCHLQSPHDYRQNRLAGAQVYFTPAGSDARSAIDAIWAGLTGGEGGPLRVRVKGRDVVIPAWRDGVGRIGFRDLCAKPLGPADYLAIANALRVLIVEDVPRLGRANFNEAKRFVTLIDALYEAKVRLVMSADAAPEQLYTAGDGAFEFERTASRLREMQSHDWGRDAA